MLGLFLCVCVKLALHPVYTHIEGVLCGVSGSAPYFLSNAQWISRAASADTTSVDESSSWGCVRLNGGATSKCHQICERVQPIRIFRFKMASGHITIRLPHISVQATVLHLCKAQTYLTWNNTVTLWQKGRFTDLTHLDEHTPPDERRLWKVKRWKIPPSPGLHAVCVFFCLLFVLCVILCVEFGQKNPSLHVWESLRRFVCNGSGGEVYCKYTRTPSVVDVQVQSDRRQTCNPWGHQRTRQDDSPHCPSRNIQGVMYN